MTTTTDAHVARVESYSGFAQLLHWVIALLVITMIPIGVIMGRIEGDVQNLLYHVHRSFGVTVLALMIIRLVYRLMHGVPAPEPTLDPWQRAVSHAVHVALYGLIIAQALIGWIATSAYGATIWIYGLFVMPDLIAQNRELSGPLFLVHEILGFTIAGLLLLHIGAALFHYFIRGDRVLQRMLP